MIWCSPPADQPYSSPLYDPFWAAAQDLEMPVSLHAITGMERIPWEYGAEQRAMRPTVTPHEIEKSFSTLILSGVLERFPRLKIVSAENNCGWLPYYLQRVDRAFTRFSALLVRRLLGRRSSPSSPVNTSSARCTVPSSMIPSGSRAGIGLGSTT